MTKPADGSVPVIPARGSMPMPTLLELSCLADHSVRPKSSPLARFPKLNDKVMAQAVPLDYFERAAARGVEVQRVADSPVYLCRNGFARSMIIDTDDGLAVFDSFSASHSAWLNSLIASHFGSKPVRWLVYSHYHLDHTRGGAALQPHEVIAHRKVPQYLADFVAPDVAVVTTPIAGDVTLTFGKVEVHAYDLGLSHTDCLYGFHIPALSLLFTADAGFVKSLPPFGFPDWYYPGYMRALDRLATLDFGLFVPTHGDLGTKADFVDFSIMMRDVRESVERECSRHDMAIANGRTIRAVLADTMPGLRARWGHWHGFDGMMLPLFFRHVGGTYLGH
jgi:glyoxylase-like metal-dependent hydrolase (beta-lactamase superfamily II)